MQGKKISEAVGERDIVGHDVVLKEEVGFEGGLAADQLALVVLVDVVVGGIADAFELGLVRGDDRGQVHELHRLEGNALAVGALARVADHGAVIFFEMVFKLFFWY
jgi:hypothetical protein